MEFSVPGNWDPVLPGRLTDIPEITDIYGVEDVSPYASGRPKYMLPKASRRRMASFIASVHERGWTFTYLMNSPVLGGREHSTDFRKRLDRHLARLGEIGVDFITVANPLLADMVRTSAPGIGLKVSVIAGVGTPREVELWKRHGVLEITLDVHANRDFKILEELARERDVGLRLLLNERCLYRCPYRAYHYSQMGETDLDNTALFNYCNYLCSDIFLNDPSQFIKMPVVRPEDLHLYESAGFQRFKLSGRTYPSSWIESTIRAYSARKYDGNLLDLVDTDFNSNKQQSENAERFKKRLALLLRIPPPVLKALFTSVSFFPSSLFPNPEQKNLVRVLSNSPFSAYRDFFRWLETYLHAPGFVSVDNRALDDFTSYFLTNRCDRVCEECGYCDEIAGKAVHLGDREKIDRFLEATRTLRSGLITGDYFR